MALKQKELEDALAAEKLRAKERYDQTRLEVAKLREKLREEEANRERRNNQIDDLNMKLLQKDEASADKKQRIQELQAELRVEQKKQFYRGPV